MLVQVAIDSHLPADQIQREACDLCCQALSELPDWEGVTAEQLQVRYVTMSTYLVGHARRMGGCGQVKHA